MADAVKYVISILPAMGKTGFANIGDLPTKEAKVLFYQLMGNLKNRKMDELGQETAFQHWFGEAFESDDCKVVGNIYENKNLLEP